jgi:hypothetical protein
MILSNYLASPIDSLRGPNMNLGLLEGFEKKSLISSSKIFEAF